MDINSIRVEMITGRSIEEATESLNQFLKVCEYHQTEVYEVEYYPLQDKESKAKHSYLVRYSRYSEAEKEAYLLSKGVNQIAEAWKGYIGYKK